MLPLVSCHSGDNRYEDLAWSGEPAKASFFRSQRTKKEWGQWMKPVFWLSSLQCDDALLIQRRETHRVRPEKNLQLSDSSSKLQSDVCFLARVATSGECLRGEGLVWLIGAVVCVVAAALRSCTIGSCQSTATSCGCTARLVAALPV